jgi:hypothetical protein
MNDKKLDKVDKLLLLFSKIITVSLATLFVVIGIYRATTSNITSEILTCVLISFIGGLLILLTSFAIDLGLDAWEKSISWLAQPFRKYPYGRFGIIVINLLFGFYTAYLVFRFVNIDWSLKVFIGLYLIWFFPAAITSLVREDLSREHTKLSKRVTREVRIQNPQAAIEIAFTHFEDQLRRRIAGDSNLYGNNLIKAAYGEAEGRLVYVSDGKENTQHLYHLMSGAYSIFRNPRHHKIINDGEQKAQAMISTVELLMEFIDDSEDRQSTSENPGQKSKTITKDKAAATK